MINTSTVRALAEMARIELAQEELGRIAAQLTDILEQIAVLASVADPPHDAHDVRVADAFVEDSDNAALRPDAPGADEMHGRLGRFAPELRDGFFTVPLLPTQGPAAQS